MREEITGFDTELVQESTQFVEALKAVRLPVENLWTEISRHLSPNELKYIAEFKDVQGRRERTNILRFDGSATVALKRCVGLMLNHFAPSGNKWFDFKPISRADELRYADTFFEINDRIFQEMYLLNSSFSQTTIDCIHSVLAYGNSCVYINEKPELNGVDISTVPIDTVWVSGDNSRAVKKFVVQQMLNLAEIAEWYPEYIESGGQLFSNSGGNATQIQKETAIINIVLPAKSIDIPIAKKLKNPKKYEWLLLTYIPQTRELLRYSFLDFCPYIYFRGSAFPNSTTPYGDSIGAEVLPNLMTTNLMERDRLSLAAHISNPKILAYVSELVSMKDLVRGNGGVVRISDRGYNSGRPSASVLQVDGRGMPITAEVMNGQRQTIMQFFMLDMLQSSMSATARQTTDEVMIRMAERSAVLMPYLGRFYSEYASPILNTYLKILSKEGQVEIPKELTTDKDVRLAFKSPAIKSMNSDRITGLIRTAEIAANLMAVYPEMRFKLDAMKYLNEFAEAMDVSDVLVDDNVAQSKVEAMQAQQQMMADRQYSLEMAKQQGQIIR